MSQSGNAVRDAEYAVRRIRGTPSAEQAVVDGPLKKALDEVVSALIAIGRDIDALESRVRQLERGR
jgi:hypothetical protein